METKTIQEEFEKEYERFGLDTSEIQKNILNILFPKLRFGKVALYFVPDGKEHQLIKLKKGNSVSIGDLDLYTEKEAEKFIKSLDQELEKMNKMQEEIHDYVLSKFGKCEIVEGFQKIRLKKEFFYIINKKVVRHELYLSLPFETPMVLTEENGYQKEEIDSIIQSLKTKQTFLQIAKHHDPCSFVSFADGIGSAVVVLFGKIYKIKGIGKKISFQDLEQKVKAEKLKSVFEGEDLPVLVPYWIRNSFKEWGQEIVFPMWLKETFQDEIAFLIYEHKKEFEEFMLENS